MVEHRSQSEVGRFRVLKIFEDDSRIVCASTYAPNDSGSQVDLFKQLNSLLQQFSGKTFLVEGITSYQLKVKTF